MVTVAPAFNSKAAIGLPTIFERPITRAFLPTKSILYSLKISIIPSGVQGTKPSSPEFSLPTFRAWKPSTSLLGSIRLKTSFVSRCFGSGSWTRIPWMLSSLFSTSIRLKSSFCVVCSPRRCMTEPIPAAMQAFSLLATYVWLALSSPTKITAKVGLIPFATSSSQSFFTLSFVFALNALPSIIVILTTFKYKKSVW